MADLAELGIRVQSHEVEVASDRMDAAAASAHRLESATERVTAAARYSSSSMATMNAAVRQQNEIMAAARNVTGLTSYEVMNLSRQFGDVGVSIASGMPIWMVAIQQGDQIRGTFAEASARGVGFGAAMRSVAASLGPVLIPLGLVAAAAAVASAGFGLLHRELGKSYPDDITVGLGLTEEQLRRVEDRTVTFGDTFMATMTVIGRHIMDGPIGDALDGLGEQTGNALDGMAKLWVEGWALQIGVAVGAYRTIIENWRRFPAAIGEISTAAANLFIRGVEAMVNRQIDGFNAIGRASNAIFRTKFADLAHLDLPEVQQQFAGATSAIGLSLAENVTTEINRARAALIALGREIGDEALARAVRRALEQAGDPNKARAGGRSETEKQVDETLRYIEALKDQAATYGMSAIAAKQYEIAQRALKAPTEELRREIERYGEALVGKMIAEAANTQALQDQLAMTRLEARLIGAGNIERAKQIAQMAEIQRLRALGVPESDPTFMPRVRAAGAVAEEDARLQQSQAAFQYSLQYTLDLTRQIDDAARSAGRGFEEAFGNGGGMIAAFATGITGLNADLAGIAEAQRRYAAEVGENADPRRLAMFEQERANVTIAAYGDMISAARGYFREGSDGYKAMLAIEQVYRAYQFASAIQAMALGGQETAFTLGQNAIRAASHGVVAVARAIASLPFPLNLAAGAATIAALAAIGVKIAGGGGGGRAVANDNDIGPDHSTNAVRSYSAMDAQARDQATSAIASKVEIRVTADREGLNAYVANTAQKEAFGVAAPMVAAAAAGTKRDVMETLHARQVGNRKISV